MEEKDIISGCQSGEKHAFQVLVERYSPMLMAVSQRYIVDKHLAEDLLQEAFILIFRNIENFQPGGSFEAWLKKIMVNTCLKSFRNKRINEDLDLADHQGIAEPVFQEHDMDAEKILRMLNSLEEDHRIILNLAIVEGYSHLEIAEILSIQESTSRTRLTRARKVFKRLLLKINEIPSS